MTPNINSAINLRTFNSIKSKNNLSLDESIHCIHKITQEDNNSILSLAIHSSYLFSGSQESDIYVWDLHTFQLVTTLKGHCGSVLDLTISQDQNWLFSCSGDSTVRVWSIKELKCKYVIHSCHDVGDIFSILFTEQSKLLIFGCQNTSIEWFDFNQEPTHQPEIKRENCQKSRFFKLFHDLGFNSLNQQETRDENVTQCVIKTNHVYSNAHDGYIYCMTYSINIPNLEGEVLITGSGDGLIKIWSIKNKSLIHYQTLKGNDPDSGILSLSISDDGYLFCGVQGGKIQVWDLETYQMIRSIGAHTDDVLSVIKNGFGFTSASADGIIKVWNEDFEYTNEIDNQQGIILSMKKSENYLITSNSQHSIMIWDLNFSESPKSNQGRLLKNQYFNLSLFTPQDIILYILEQWISIRSISGQIQYLEECRRGARYFKNILKQLGASSQLLPTTQGKNPLVYGKFSSNSTKFNPDKTPTVLFYGHYDVMNADNQNNEWLQDPFELTGMNGYLYGRGTSDNKGPIVASVVAVHELFKKGELDVNVIFLIEGEEENGSGGFMNAIHNFKHLFSSIDLILLSNSYWLGEDIPCITYGLRGVIHANLKVTSPFSDLHSGVEGGAVSEPLMDLIHVIGKLSDTEKNVLIPGFYDDVLPVSESEEKLYEPIVDWIQSSFPLSMSSRSQHSCITSPSLSCSTNSEDEFSSTCSTDDGLTSDQIKKQLMSKWRYPTLTVHKIDVSINNKTVISRDATCAVSMRIVPNQDMNTICQNFKHFIYSSFDKLNSDNQIEVEIKSIADYWLGNPESKYFKIAELAVEKEWKVKPLYIREGGSIPAVKWLEQFCGAPAIHIPLGQSSDQAHLPNERIRLSNLHAGKRIIKTLLKNI